MYVMQLPGGGGGGDLDFLYQDKQISWSSKCADISTALITGF